VNLGSLELSHEEFETVDRFNQRFAGRRHPVTADTLFDNWMSLVAEVEGGYDSSVDDYGNDLTSRDLLEDLIQDSQPSLRAKLERALEPWDERFRRATAHDDRRALSRFFNIGDGWWWRRTPTEGQLATYLRQRVPSPGAVPEAQTDTDRHD
jgi:hypothetical protein